MTQKSSFFIAGRHAVMVALRNPKRRGSKIFLTEESKKNIHKQSPHKNLLKDLKVFFKWWRGKDSNLRRPKSTGLQPAPFDRFGTPPNN